MVKFRCRNKDCDSSIEFANLKELDFPKGWECEFCIKAEKSDISVLKEHFNPQSDSLAYPELTKEEKRKPGRPRKIEPIE